jgi:hypothetical protein
MDNYYRRFLILCCRSEADSIGLGSCQESTTWIWFCRAVDTVRCRTGRVVIVLSGTRLDGRIIRVELDGGFQPGRQYMDVVYVVILTKKRYDAPQQIDPYRMKALHEVLLLLKQPNQHHSKQQCYIEKNIN